MGLQLFFGNILFHSVEKNLSMGTTVFCKHVVFKNIYSVLMEQTVIIRDSRRQM